MSQVVYRIDVSPVLTGNGLALWERSGEVRSITDGQVVLAHREDGTPVNWQGSCSLDGWHATRADALLAAAEKVQALTAPILGQIRRLWSEALK